MMKNLIFDPILAYLAHILALHFFSQVLPLLDVRHCIQFQGKLIIQTHQNDKKPHFGPDLGSLDPNSGRRFLFSKI